MKKVLLSVFALSGIITLNAQNWVADSVATGPQYVNRVFYSLENGQVGSFQYNNRDWFIDVSESYSASIRINGGFSAELYKYTAGDTSDWSSLDTTGLSAGNGWLRARDTEDAYAPSAFEVGMTGHPNYGWGVYNSTTHDVVGDKLFVYKTVGNGTPGSAQWKKVWIEKLAATTSAFTVRVADLNGANEQTITISKAGVTGKSTIYYSFATGQTYNDEPAMADYDLIFTKMVGLYGTTPNQAVTGVEINHDVLVAKAAGIDEEDAVYTDYTLEDKLNGIGSDWKALNQQFQWFTYDSVSYFVQDVPGNIWQIRFTGFGGGSTGKYKFEKRQVGTVSVEEPNSTIPAVALFPNPATDNAQIVFTALNNAKMQLQVLDMSGRLVLNESKAASAGINQWQLPLNSLTNGMYIVKLTDGITVKTEKLMIRK